MPTRFAFAVLVLLLLTAFAPAPLPRRSTRLEMHTIRGAWLLTGQLRQNALTPDNKGIQWTFLDGRLEILDGGKKYFWETTVDERATPRTLEMRYKADGQNYSYLRALFTVEGDKLTIGYFPGRWETRPATLDSAKDAELLVQVYRRVGR